MRKIEELSDKTIKLLFISLIVVVALLLLVIFVGINISFEDNKREEDEFVGELYYEISIDEINLPQYDIGQDYVKLLVNFPRDYTEKDSFLDEDYYFYSPIFATLRNECEIASSQECRYMVNDDTVVLLIYQKSNNQLDEVRAFHINSWVGW